MDLTFSAEHEEFRQGILGFLNTHGELTTEPWVTAAGRPSGAAKQWQRLLIQHGYTCRTFPKEYGGYGDATDVMKSYIISQEFTAAQMPLGMANQGISMLAPTLLERGTEEQRRRWIRQTLEGEIIWCQGYSEPGAGSDLASLSTKATEDGDDFIINGQKIWTSGAQASDMMFVLVRTEPKQPKHRGISYLLLPMDTPGIKVQPLKTMTGRAEFNEVFFTDVRVPQDQIVGQRGEGWQVANTTLKHERGMLGNPDRANSMLKSIIAFMQEERLNGIRLMDIPVYRDRLLQLQGRAQAMQYHGLRLLTCSDRGVDPGLARMIVKLNGTELNHDIAGFAIDVLGEIGALYGDSPLLRRHGFWQTTYMFSLGLIIGGGTSQIQKNIISERGLGMPKEPKVSTSGG